MKKKIILTISVLAIIVIVLMTWLEHREAQEISIRMCHDSRLVGNIRQLSLALELYYDDEEGYPQSSDSDFPIEFVEKYDKKLAGLGFEHKKLAELDLDGNEYCYYNWTDNTSDNKKVCFYAYSEFDNIYYAASHRGYYECKDKTPTLDDCCFP